MARLSRHLQDYYIGDSETGSPSPPFNYYYHHYYIGDSEIGSPSPPLIIIIMLETMRWSCQHHIILLFILETTRQSRYPHALLARLNSSSEPPVRPRSATF